MTERWDVVYGEHGPHLEPHFCREWDGERGCYGTNPDHGFSWEEARNETVQWWRQATPGMIGYFLTSEVDATETEERAMTDERKGEERRTENDPRRIGRYDLRKTNRRSPWAGSAEDRKGSEPCAHAETHSWCDLNVCNECLQVINDNGIAIGPVPDLDEECEPCGPDSESTDDAPWWRHVYEIGRRCDAMADVNAALRARLTDSESEIPWDAFEELTNYIRDDDERQFCRACSRPIGSHDTLCPMQRIMDYARTRSTRREGA